MAVAAACSSNQCVAASRVQNMEIVSSSRGCDLLGSDYYELGKEEEVFKKAYKNIFNCIQHNFHQ